MSETAQPKDLKKMIAERKIIAVAGSGISRATTQDAPLWGDLIESGIQRCVEVGETQAWCDAARSMLKVGSLDMLLMAAELVHGKLNENGGGEFAAWLRECFESLEPQDRTVIEALATLELPLITTNYDDLIEQVTGLKHVTWQDRRLVTREVRRDDRRVLHLHGHWEQPESVVLGLRSYIGVSEDPHTQAVLKALGVGTSFLFVGCGEEGLSDPNWGRFLEWLKQHDIEGSHEHRHYRLVLEKDRFKPDGRLFPLVYGTNYSELAGFLRSLAPEDATAAMGHVTTQRVTTTVSDCVSDYIRRLEEHTKHLELMGLGRSLQVDLPIAEAYVPLRTTLHRSFESRETDRFHDGHDEAETEVELGEVFRRSDELGVRGVVLLGEPGSGKTTGAKQLAWRLASGESLPTDLGLPAGITPVLLKFRELSREIIAEKKNGLRRFLVEQTHCPEATNGWTDPGPDLWDADGGLLWILDGLDEVVDPKARRKVSKWVQSALRNRPQDRFLVTCRFQGYYRQGVPLGAKFAEFHVRPLDDDQIRQFVRDWFTAAYKKLYGPGDNATTRANEVRERLLTILSLSRYQTGGMRELCTNPLLLTILCIVFHEERKLPTERAELYSRCVRVLLEHWRRELYDGDTGGDVKAYDADAAQSVLARMAWWMHQQQDRTAAPLDELAAEAEQGLAPVAASSGLGRDGHRFIDRMRDEAGILAMSGEGDGRCGFLHLSFQEFLAATYAASAGLAQELATQAASSWWRETALLSLRSSEAYCREFFTEMLKAGIAEEHPNLAEQCLDEALFIPPEPFLKLLQSKRPNPDRLAAVLRLLRSRTDQVPGLEDIVGKLAASKHGPVASLAQEITAKLNPAAPRVISSEAEPTDTSSTGVAAEPGALWVDDRTGITYVWIPAGRFMMGAESEQKGHQVQLTEPFWLARYPVTNAQFGRFLEAPREKISKPKYWDERRFNQPEQPVVGVSWDDAIAFAEWAAARLPTEAEWEYACRAESPDDFCFGNDVDRLGEYAWYNKNSENQLQPVGAKQANNWGLHDMHGNVWEWCQDWHGNYSTDMMVDPAGPSDGSLRVLRGGCWLLSSQHARSAYRNRNSPGYRDFYLGFRVAAVPATGEGGASSDG